MIKKTLVVGKNAMNLCCGFTALDVTAADQTKDRSVISALYFGKSLCTFSLTFSLGIFARHLDLDC